MPDWTITRLRGEYCVTWFDVVDADTTIRRRYRLGTSDPKEAERRAPSKYAELTRPRGTKVKDLWAAYLHAKQGRAVLATMEYTWRAMGERFGELEAGAVSVDDCRAHTAERHTAGIQDGTIHTELGHLRMVLKWAQDNGLLDRAPHIEKPPKPEPLDYHITRAEAARLLASANVPHIGLTIRLLIASGARVTAALELTWDRVDFGRRMLNLRDPFDRKRRKGRAVVPINDQLYEALVEAKKAALSPYVIEWAGHKLQSVKKGFKAAGIAAGLPDVSPHVMRHSAAVWLAEDGISMSEIAQFLGHSNTKMTEKVYARYSPTYLRKLGPSLEF